MAYSARLNSQMTERLSRSNRDHFEDILEMVCNYLATIYTRIFSLINNRKMGTL